MPGTPPGVMKDAPAPGAPTGGGGIVIGPPIVVGGGDIVGGPPYAGAALTGAPVEGEKKAGLEAADVIEAPPDGGGAIPVGGPVEDDGAPYPGPAGGAP
jgi:hypothetical protein